MERLETNQSDLRVQLRVSHFGIPPVRNCRVVRRKSSVGCVALLQPLARLHGGPFHDLHPNDALIPKTLLRRSALKEVSADRPSGLVLKQVKPLTSEEEVMQLKVEPQMSLEDRA